MPFAPVAGGQVYYEVDGEGPALVFAHGAGGNHLSWWQQAPVFRDRYRCVVFDHRGFGQSVEAEGGPGPSAFVDDLLALLDHLGVEQTALVAQSMGGWSCLGLALRAPERVAALVMADTLGGVSNAAIEGAAREGRERVAREGLAHLAFSPRLRQRRPDLAFLYQEIMTLNPPRGPQWGEALRAARVAPETLAGLRVPTLWVVGSEDPLTPPAAIQEGHRLTPGSEYFEAAEAGHSVYFERAEAFNARVAAFLQARGWPGAAARRSARASAGAGPPGRLPGN